MPVRIIRRGLQWIGVAVIMLAVAVALFVFLGGYNVAATSEHGPVVRWLLISVRDASVAIRQPDSVSPPLTDTETLRLAAGHYAGVCEKCHSAPGLPPTALGQAMTPSPPYFAELAGTHKAEGTFWIIRHGIKMTGMPAWPAPGRRDEVLAMVALVERLPEMSAEDFRALAYGKEPEQPVDRLRSNCVRCHGVEGNGRPMPNLPILAQQKVGYLSNALDAFRSGTRHSGFMQAVATHLTNDDIRRLAEHYAAAPRTMPPSLPTDISSPTDLSLELGRRLAREGTPDTRVTACSTCHGPRAERKNPFFPDIRGQPADYIREQLQLFRSNQRGGTAYRNLMKPIADSLRNSEIDALARYYSSLSPGPESGIAVTSPPTRQ